MALFPQEANIQLIGLKTMSNFLQCKFLLSLNFHNVLNTNVLILITKSECTHCIPSEFSIKEKSLTFSTCSSDSYHWNQ